MATNLFDLTKWIDELKATGELKDEEATALTGILSRDKVSAKLKDSFQLRGATQSYMDRLRTEHEGRLAEITEREEANDKFAGTLKTWKQEREAEQREYRKQVKAVEDRVRALAEANGVDPEKDWDIPLSSLTSGRSSARSGDGGDDSIINNRDKSDAFLKDLEGKLVGEVRNSALFTTRIADIQAEHQLLFGKPLTGVSNLLEQSQKQRKPLMQVWEESNHVPERRAEMVKQEQEKHDREIADTAVNKYVSEHATDRPLTRADLPTDAGSPMLDMFHRERKPEQIPSSERTVSKALEAMNSGKYRSKSA
jgi:hypothetical protein